MNQSIFYNDAITARCEMFTVRYPSDEAQGKAKDEIREAAQVFAKAIRISLASVPADVGRVVAALDLIQQAKNVAIDAIILKQALNSCNAITVSTHELSKP